MVLAKNYEAMSTFVKVMQKKLCPLFFPDTVYITNQQVLESKCLPHLEQASE